MRINWFCPLPPARTGIAVWAANVLPYFAAQHEVRLFAAQEKVHPEIEKLGKIIRYHPSSPPWTDLNGADLTFYHIGNNPDFHSEVHEIAKLHPGVMVLHDLRLHDFVWMTYVGPQRNFQSYVVAMQRWYGVDGMRAARQFIDAGHMHRETADDMAQRYPLTREVAGDALGVVTHSRMALEELGELPDCPVAALHFPHAGMSEEAYRQIAGARRHHTPPYRILVFGYIQLNRRVVPLLEALAGLNERDQFRLEICGELWDRAAITSAVERLGLKKQVAVRGHLPPAAVPRAFADADIGINLRYPTMGEASLSQMEFWDYGLPTIVTRTGWYASLPEEAVCFVDPSREIEDIQEHLRKFLAHPELLQSKGEAGRRALARHHPREYAEQVVKFATQATGAAHRIAGAKLATRAGLEMRTWLHPSMSEHMLNKVSTEISDLFYGRDETASTRKTAG